jgi:hypothetical protein
MSNRQAVNTSITSEEALNMLNIYVKGRSAWRWEWLETVD